jgi:hypothetical protein
VLFFGVVRPAFLPAVDAFPTLEKGFLRVVEDPFADLDTALVVGATDAVGTATSLPLLRFSPKMLPTSIVPELGTSQIEGTACLSSLKSVRARPHTKHARAQKHARGPPARSPLCSPVRL